MKQLSFIKAPRKDTKLWWIEKQKNYGGSLNYRKVERPFDSKQLVHIVFKAKLGDGIWFTRSSKSIQTLLIQVANKYDIKIKEKSINKDHIHILIWTKTRQNLIQFLRLFAAEMGRKYKEIFKRFGLNKIKNLWIARPFTRLVSWGKRSVDVITKYIQKNTNEALGFIEYKPRKHRLNVFLQKWQEQSLVASG
ncbi:MAG TPA: transposase [Pseudobdellovibrionaceae bacterium]|nr:transposase [Pseudobdellovibrionaceae bacterium]